MEIAGLPSTVLPPSVSYAQFIHEPCLRGDVGKTSHWVLGISHGQVGALDEGFL